MAPIIGDTDIKAIAQTYTRFGHAFGVPQKQETTVWGRVKEALKDAGESATQARAAKIAGVQQPSVSDWNKVGFYPSLESAVAIAKATNTCVEWIMTGRGPKHPGPPEEPAALELWNLWGRLPELRKGEILGMAKTHILPIKKAEPDELQRRTGRTVAHGR